MPAIVRYYGYTVVDSSAPCITPVLFFDLSELTGTVDAVQHTCMTAQQRQTSLVLGNFSHDSDCVVDMLSAIQGVVKVFLTPFAIIVSHRQWDDHNRNHNIRCAVTVVRKFLMDRGHKDFLIRGVVAFGADPNA